MADASFSVNSFLGGEWSQYIQGRFDEPTYKTALNVCFNAIPLEEGNWTRRPGTMFAGFSRRATQGRLIGFDLVSSAPYDFELTSGWLRVWQGQTLALDEAPVAVTAISTANPAVLQTTATQTWATGDSVQLFFSGTDLNYLAEAYLANRQFVVTMIDDTHFSLADQSGNTIDGSKFVLGGSTITAGHILEIATPWDDIETINNVRIAQSEEQVLMFAYQTPTQTFTIGGNLFGTQKQFSLAATVFVDGPYLDPPTNGSNIEASGTSGSVTLTASTAIFASTDVGRDIRLFSQPAPWNVGTDYSSGDYVTWNGVYYQCIKDITAGAHTPDIAIYEWAIYPSGAQWAYAIITAFTDPTHVTATLHNIPPPPGPNVIIPPIGPLLYTHDSGNPILTYQLGLFTNTGPAWPQGGTYHEGRFWFYGARQNRVDSGVANNGLTCSPSYFDGTVADDSGISVVFNFPEIMAIAWMQPNHSGIICGTQSGEVVIQSSNLSDPITPTSIQAHLVSSYGSNKIEPLAIGYSNLFVDRYAKKLIDFSANIYSQRYSGINVSLTGRHLTEPGLLEIRYQRELSPIVWATVSNGEGNWVGMSYKREDNFSTNGPLFNAWHRHAHGGNRYPESITTGTSLDGTTDTLAMITTNPNSVLYDFNMRHVEFLTPIFQETQDTKTAWQLDDAIVPVSAHVDGQTVVFYGYWHLLGRTVSVFVAGLDCGDYVVASDGSVTVPFGACDGLFTLAYLESISGYTQNVVNIINGSLTAPSFLSQPSVQSYINPSLSGGNECCAAIDVANNRIFSTGPADAQTYLTSYDFTSGAVNNYDSNVPATGATIQFQDAMTLDTSGDVWAFDNNLQRVAELVPGSTWALGDVGGASELSGWSASSFVWTEVAGKSYLIGGGFARPGADTRDIAAFNITGGSVVPNGLFQNTGGTTSVVAGPAGTAYWTVQPFSIYGTAYALGSTTISGGGLSNISIKSYLPTDFDATWTFFDSFSGPAYDQTDGNVIVMVTGHGPSSNAAYIAKLRVSDGQVLWKVSMPDNHGFSDQGILNSVIEFGYFLYFANSNQVVYLISTADGTFITQTSTGGVIALGNQSSNDSLGCIIGNGTWDTALGALTLLNSTASSGGPVLTAIYFATAGTSTPAIVATIPVVIGFTFNSDGQLVRTQDPERSGARNGPALGKKRRNMQAAFQFVNAINGSVQVGTTFPPKYTWNFLEPGDTPYTVLQPFTGVWWDTVDDDYSFDGMIAWRIGRPYPLTVTAIEGFVHTQDR